MPNLNVISWNSTGETAQGATVLQDVIQHLTANNWQPQVLIIQEANAAPGGAIHTMLAGLGPAYNQPPAHTIEGSPLGRGYLLLTHTSVGGQGTLARHNLAADPQLQAWINGNLSLQAKQIATAEIAAMPMPATAALTLQGRHVDFLTWHAPRGVGQVLQTATLSGGANPDAYLFLQNCAAYAALAGPGVGNLSVIAGDLNVAVGQINGRTGIPSLPALLPGWTGVSDKLDHILAHPGAGQPHPQFTGSGHFAGSGDHNILLTALTW